MEKPPTGGDSDRRMNSSELEDGELPSDDEQECREQPGSNGWSANRLTLPLNSEKTPPFRTAMLPQVDAYRSSGHGEESDSEEKTDSDDDDTGLWERKRAKFQQRTQASAALPQFVNPLLSQDPSEAFQPCKSNTGSKRQVNNVWSAVLTEQTIVGALGTTLSDNTYKACLDYKGDRDVESYDYTKKYEDDRESVPSEESAQEDELFSGVAELPEVCEEKHVSRKRRHRNRKKRQKKSDQRDRSSCPSDEVTVRDNVPTVARHIQKELQEPKYFLIERIVGVIGKASALKYLSMTKTVEENGGMLIKSGKRRRSPGGVFLQLIRESKDITAEQMDKIFTDEDNLFQQRIALKAQRKLKKAEEKAAREEAVDMAQDRGPNSADSSSDNFASTHNSDRSGSEEEDACLYGTDVVDIPL